MGDPHNPLRSLPGRRQLTRRVALIGNPLKRRHSAVMQNAAFAAHGIDATYELRPIGPDEVGASFSEAS